MHVEAVGASMEGQAGCALWALSGPRRLWEGGCDSLGWPVYSCRGYGCKYGGAGWVRAVFFLGAERTMGGGLGWSWDGLFVHVEAAGASMGGQAGCAV